MRLFTAINFDKNTKDALCGVMDALKARGVRGNFSLRQNLHLTLVFLGETGCALHIKSAMDKLAFEPFSLEIAGLGIWNSGILWCGIKQNPALSDIYTRLSASLRQLGFKTDSRPFTPHLTICRKAEFPQGTAADTFSRLVPNIHQSVTHISLMKSDRVNGVLKYTEIHRIESVNTCI